MSPPHYMILDNDNINSSVLIEILEFIGECTYHVLTSPQQLLEVLEINKPDTIFCNVTAKGCDARELCNNQAIDYPLVFISVLDKSEERRQCFLNSGYPYITSPLSPEIIQRHI
jgi:CheY-like chemotaxis protein